MDDDAGRGPRGDRQLPALRLPGGGSETLLCPVEESGLCEGARTSDGLHPYAGDFLSDFLWGSFQ